MYERMAVKKVQHPKRWDDRILYASQGNSKIHKSTRAYFNKTADQITRNPTDPRSREMVRKRTGLYLKTRDPRFYQPEVEAGWNNRAGITAARHQKIIHMTRKYYDGGIEAPAPPLAMSDPSNYDEEGQRLDIIEKRGRGKFEFLRKHSRLPITPILADIQGYDNSPQIMDRSMVPKPPNAQKLAYIAQSQGFFRDPKLDFMKNGGAQTDRSHLKRSLKMRANDGAITHRPRERGDPISPKGSAKPADRALKAALGRVVVPSEGWDDRFHVMVSKDNTKSHNAFREYFDTPRQFSDQVNDEAEDYFF